ncbi:MAG TPA: histidine kinase [Burkholderiales bacterium]|nr:histidine kinase [Burkholderiales bacterium]
MARSINQNAYSSALPNFRNLGVLLRILIFVNFVAIAAAALKTTELRAMLGELLEISAVVQPLLILSLLTLVVANNGLRRLPGPAGIAAVLAIELGLTLLLYQLGRSLPAAEPGSLLRYWLVVLLVTAALLKYFQLRNSALSPALSEARLQALEARIRPHFLFNSLNAVLSLIRENPKRAEEVLEDMADLFRVLMADNRELTPLSREIDLCRQYLDLEQLRLGDRLAVDWQIGQLPPGALVPPFVLQPLVENAVYHGIEPRTEPGVISIKIYRSGEQVHAVLRNPYAGQDNRHAGNKMALANIRERLQLHFDAEASLTAKVRDDSYEVHIVMPYLKGQPTDEWRGATP